MPFSTASAGGAMRAAQVNAPPRDFDPRRDLPAGFLEFLAPLHREFAPLQKKLVAKREEKLLAASLSPSIDLHWLR